MGEGWTWSRGTMTGGEATAARPRSEGPEEQSREPPDTQRGRGTTGATSQRQEGRGEEERDRYRAIGEQRGLLARTTAMVWSLAREQAPGLAWLAGNWYSSVCDVTAARLKAEEAGAAQHAVHVRPVTTHTVPPVLLRPEWPCSAQSQASLGTHILRILPANTYHYHAAKPSRRDAGPVAALVADGWFWALEQEAQQSTSWGPSPTSVVRPTTVGPGPVGRNAAVLLLVGLSVAAAGASRYIRPRCDASAREAACVTRWIQGPAAGAEC
ncbi:hypothetical protein VTN96DRAFT_1732 [Rasamsonia emersonii]